VSQTDRSPLTPPTDPMSIKPQARSPSRPDTTPRPKAANVSSSALSHLPLPPARTRYPNCHLAERFELRSMLEALGCIRLSCMSSSSKAPRGIEQSRIQMNCFLSTILGTLRRLRAVDDDWMLRIRKCLGC
jgi:hypothetical protein